MTKPALSYVFLGTALIACAAGASACAEGLMLAKGRPLSPELDTGADAPMRVIFHDGSHAPVSVPMTPNATSRMTDGSASDTSDDPGNTMADADPPVDGASTPIGGGPSEPITPYRPRQGVRWQTFLPGSLK